VEGFRLSGSETAAAEEEEERKHPAHSPAKSGLLSQQLASASQQQQQQQQDELHLLSRAADPADFTADELAELNLTEVPDLTEAAEESLMQRSGMTAAAAARCSSQEGEGAAAAESATSSGPCLLALPAADAADVGVWQLGQQGSSSSSSTRPDVLLQQQRSQDRPKHGLCMAVALLQPQVGYWHNCSSG
jgi:hypothetical protein